MPSRHQDALNVEIFSIICHLFVELEAMKSKRRKVTNVKEGSCAFSFVKQCSECQKTAYM